MFWEKAFLDKIKQGWLDEIVEIKYTLNNVEYEGVIQSKKISGDNMEIYIVVDEFVEGTNVISSIRLYDSQGNMAGSTECNITKVNEENVLIKFEFPMKEVI